MSELVDILPENNLTTLKGYVNPAVVYWGSLASPEGQDGAGPTPASIGIRRPTRLTS